MNLEAKHYTLEEAKEKYPDYYEDHGDGDVYFGKMLWHGNVDWIDFWPEDGAVVVTEAETGDVIYMLPASFRMKK